MDRSWIKSRMFSREHVNGVNEFMTFVSERFNDDEEMLCPCRQCLNRVRKPKGQKQTKFKDAPPTAIDIFKDTHCSSKSGFNENAKDAIAQMEAYVAQPTEEGKDPKTPVQAIAHVLPK